MNAAKVERLNNFVCENFIFDANFDSGNLFKVELVKKIGNSSSENAQSANEQNNVSQSSTSSNSKDRQIDIEFNLWTRPDCFHGSLDPTKKPCRNAECNGNCSSLDHGNRTWFFFSIKGGDRNQLVKFNVLNLNKQAKLFSQGMHPVVRNGMNGKWERVKEKPTFILTEDSFSLSFTHRTTDNVEDNLTFYAFTFPYTYTEQIQALDMYDKKYKKNLEELSQLVKEINSTGKERIVIDMPHPTVNSFDFNQQQFDKERSQFSVTIEDALDGTSMQDNFENYLLNIKSLGSSIDDNTSDSMQQLSSLVNNVKIEKVNEFAPTIIRTPIEDLKNEIYYYRELLVLSYEQRRVDILTITSFEGIQEEREERIKNLFPDLSVPRSHTFKNKKIIFLSSRVHPGETPGSHILNGFINLLLDKKSQIASTLRKLYVFKIIPFLNPDGVYNGLYRSDTLGHNLNRVYLSPTMERHPSIYAVRKLIRFYHFGCDKPDNEETRLTDGIFKNYNENESLIDENCKIDDIELPECSMFLSDPEKSTDTATKVNDPEKALSEPLPQTTVKKHIAKPKSTLKKLKDTAMNVKTMVSSERKLCSKDDSNAKVTNHHHYKHLISHYNCEKAAEKMYSQQLATQNQQNLNISMEYRIKTDENGEKSIADENSNLFLYLDFHGHASKKGVFMYGNHLSNVMESVEVMLLPKLMSLNCHHFHFDACNFSERNMYLKGRRDGLSKEGSGRVAIYKATGLIKSYTLESNYNVAKCVNVLPPKGKELSCKVHNLVPPKFTPAIFEEIGRALGPSLLDLTNSNPLSRIPNSEFRSLQGLRNSLKNEINRGLSRARVNKFAKMTKKRQTSVSAGTNGQDVTSKENENKGSFSSSSLSVQNSSTSTQNSQQLLKSQASILKVPKSAKVSTFLKKDPTVSKKKILRENVTTTLTNQIPHKKIRVSSSANVNAAATATEKEVSNCFVNDQELPCCSRSITSFVYQKAPSSPSSNSSSSSNSGQVKITSFMPIKKVGVKFGKPSNQKKLRSINSLDQNVAENSMSSASFQTLSDKLIKKKKRLLKPDNGATTLKRKKSRPQKPLLH